MAASLLLLLDDIASVMDDVALLTKAATKKSAGVLGDDLAVNAESVAGFPPERELPIVWAVAKGSLLNKALLVPGALLLSAVAPALVTPLLMAGGLFLCYEGFEKVLHARAARAEAPAESEADKIRGAIRTDFILSAEIIAISLGAVAGAPFWTRAAALTAVGLAVTAGVYGLVAGIVKLDDLGAALARGGGAGAGAGRLILRAAPALMRGLSIAGTAAMFLVGGGILAHGLGLHAGPELLVSAGVGLAAGAAAAGLAAAVKKLRA